MMLVYEAHTLPPVSVSSIEVGLKRGSSVPIPTVRRKPLVRFVVN